jgi:signal transduction histidine kinase
MGQGVDFESCYNVLRYISASLNSNTQVKQVLHTVVMKVSELLNSKGALIRIFNLETQEMELGAAYGLGDHYLSKGPVSSQVVITDLFRQQKAIIIRDILNDPRVQYPKEAWDEGIRMILDLPIFLGNDIVGLLRVFFDEPRDFSREELNYIILIAERGAAVIQKAQLLETQQSRYDQLVLQTEKLSALGRMAAGVAHEINNPLAGILLYSTNLLKKSPQNGPFKEALEIIVQEALRCKTIIQDLLEFSRESEPKMVLANVNKIIEKVLHILDNEFKLRHIQVDKHLSRQVPNIFLDENQIHQVFINLLLNAIQAIGEEGTITVVSHLSTDRKRIKVEVSDTGCGIPAEDKPKIFEPFFSTKPKGTGLGLWVTYALIQKHRGELYVISEPGQGAQFIAEFPIFGTLSLKNY